MENSYNREFEQFVKESTDQYRMFPSEKVWKQIHGRLHPRNRWYGIGLALLLMTTVSVTWVMLIPANRNQQIADRLPAITTQLASTNTPTAHSKPSNIPVLIRRQSAEVPGYAMDKNTGTENLFMNAAAPVAETAEGELQSFTGSIIDPLSSIVDVQPAIATVRPVPVQVVRQQSTPVRIAEPVATAPVVTEPLVYDDQMETVSVEPPAEEAKPSLNVAANTSPDLLTIESVLNSYEYIRARKNKFYMTAHFTPTVSYRQLKENNAFITQAQAASAPGNATLAVSDVNEVVTHKPDFGLQLGVTGGYYLSDRLSVSAGLQFNVSKYDIRAYSYPAENATIALIGEDARPSTFSKQSSYRSFSGTKNANWLHNLYFTASLPVGLNLRVSGNNKTEIGVGGSFQPTYVLGNRTWLLSTDYKNYVEMPSLIRRWNMTTSIEAYAGYSTGKINWRVGPQIRYQLFSSYLEQYPLKEHLFDFGLKVGIMLNK